MRVTATMNGNGVQGVASSNLAVPTMIQPPDNSPFMALRRGLAVRANLPNRSQDAGLGARIPAFRNSRPGAKPGDPGVHAPSSSGAP
jgi:hypothetical protein